MTFLGVAPILLGDFFGMVAGPVVGQAWGLEMRHVGIWVSIKERGDNGLEVLPWDWEMVGLEILIRFNELGGGGTSVDDLRL